MSIVNDLTSRVLAATLDVRAAKHGRLAHDVANIDTPGFRPTDVDFDQSLLAALGADDAQADGASAESVMVLTQGPETAPSPDGNTVDADRTLTALAENAVEFGSAAKITSKRFSLLRYVITDGLG